MTNHTTDVLRTQQLNVKLTDEEVARLEKLAAHYSALAAVRLAYAPQAGSRRARSGRAAGAQPAGAQRGHGLPSSPSSKGPGGGAGSLRDSGSGAVSPAPSVVRNLQPKGHEHAER